MPRARQKPQSGFRLSHLVLLALQALHAVVVLVRVFLREVPDRGVGEASDRVDMSGISASMVLFPEQ